MIGALPALLLGASAMQLGPEPLTQFDPLNEVRLEQRLGAALPLDARFVDESGRELRLGELFGEKPVLLALVYYECPMLCNLVLNGVVETLNAIPFRPGEDFELVAISIDPLETAELAAKKRSNYLGLYDHPETAAGWHFLVGAEDQIRAVADAVGFVYFYDPGIDEYAHASGIALATPDGRLSRYFYGVEYAANDVRLGLVEASEGGIGGAVEQILLLCFHYDPTTGRYGFAIMNALRAGAFVTVAVLLGFLFKSLRRERRGAVLGKEA